MIYIKKLGSFGFFFPTFAVKDPNDNRWGSAPVSENCPV
jgi:hypothetical protein